MALKDWRNVKGPWYDPESSEWINRKISRILVILQWHEYGEHYYHVSLQTLKTRKTKIIMTRRSKDAALIAAKRYMITH